MQTEIILIAIQFILLGQGREVLTIQVEPIDLF
jgi:hypothetical protein